ADPLTVPQIARRLGVTRQNVQRIADLLVADSAARYAANPDHRTSPHLVLTPAGTAALARLTAAAERSHAALAARTDAGDLAALHHGLRRLLAAVGPTELPPRGRTRHNPGETP
ncbi:MAG TPA: MarR family winged helix-turn-helix transcriptional regulator, partial [Hyphomicrobiales bacterium]|nr:MarR family winged helix-turn-helix transcriptional regulator [Hyphomicrobiales bacterium]